MMFDFEDINKEEFFDRFLEEYFRRGIGSLSKKDIDILILKLVLDQIGEAHDQELDVYQLSRKLKISITKLRALIKEVQIRYGQIDEEIVKRRLIYLFSRKRWIIEGKYIQLSIIDPMLRDYLSEMIFNLNSFADYSFNPEILKIEIEVFIKIIRKLSEKSLNDIICSIPEELIEFIDERESEEKIINQIININQKNLNVNLTSNLGELVGGFFRSIFFNHN
jgi:hypothetical protein